MLPNFFRLCSVAVDFVLISPWHSILSLLSCGSRLRRPMQLSSLLCALPHSFASILLSFSCCSVAVPYLFVLFRPRNLPAISRRGRVFPQLVLLVISCPFHGYVSTSRTKLSVCSLSRLCSTFSFHTVASSPRIYSCVLGLQVDAAVLFRFVFLVVFVFLRT